MTNTQLLDDDNKKLRALDKILEAFQNCEHCKNTVRVGLGNPPEPEPFGRRSHEYYKRTKY